MIINAYVAKKLTEQEELVINNICKAIDSEHQLTITIASADVNPNPNVLNLAFGPRPIKILEEYQLPSVYNFPPVSQLIDLPENKDKRELAGKLLKEIIQNKTKLQNINLDIELDLDSNDLIKIINQKFNSFSKTIQDNGDTYWLGTTSSGKKLLITNSKLNIDVTHDFKITFEELFATKLATELFDLKSLSLIKGKKDD